MKSLHIQHVLYAVALAGCANPINRVTSDNYSEACYYAEQRGQLQEAEQACYRALVNVDLGNLGPELKSQRLYSLGRININWANFPRQSNSLKNR